MLAGMQLPLRFVACVVLVLLAPLAAADVVVLKSGKKLEGVVVSREDDEVVVINPWRSRHPGMTWEIEDEHRIPRAKVAEVIRAEPPLVEARERAAAPKLSADDHVALAAFCEEHDLDDESERHLRLALALDPAHAAALEAYPASKLERWARGNPEADPELRALEREYVAASDPAALETLWKQMKELRTSRELAWLERARRSAALPKGRRDRVPLTVGSDEAPGATYCIYVPSSYDPLVPTPLVVGLHGGGRGGRDDTLVAGSGEDAMPFYQSAAERWGWVVVCPTALAAPWSASANRPLMDALLEEMALLYDVDETRIYLTGHSMGGFGTWHWGPAKADVWAAIAPCAGGGGPGSVASDGLPVFIYHGTDDAIVPPDRDRAAARSLASSKDAVDFVYTELDGVGHGFPPEVRDEIFRFFAGRRKDAGRERAVEPRSSFARKVEKREIAAFGDPRDLPEDGADDAKLADLVDDLERGGGLGAAAAEALAGRADRSTVKRVAKLLRDDESSADTRVLAARVLGASGSDDARKPLERALEDEDWRVVDEATLALGALAAAGVERAADALADAAERMGALYDASILGGERMTHTEYVVRLESFGKLCDAFAAAGAAADALGALERELVARVFTPERKLRDTDDPRFVREPPDARRALAERLAACLVALADPRGVELLERVAAAWPNESALVRAAQDGAKELRRALEGAAGE